MANPLDEWRKKASFDVKALKNLMYTEDVVEYMDQIWNTLARDPLFAIPKKDLTLNEERELSFKRSKRLMEYQFLTDEMTFENPRKKNAYVSALLILDLGAIISLQLSAEVCGVCVHVAVLCDYSIVFEYCRYLVELFVVQAPLKLTTNTMKMSIR